MSGVVWVDAQDLIELNRLLVSDTGEPFLLRERGMLESSVARPRMLAHYQGEEDVVVLACALAASIARNHPFAQGNKRTAHAAMFRFLWINGYTLDEPDDLRFAELMIMLIERAITEDEYVAAIGEHIVER